MAVSDLSKMKTQDVEVDGRVYSITPLPARKAILLKVRVVKMIAPALDRITGIVRVLFPLFKGAKEKNKEALGREIIAHITSDKPEVRAAIGDLFSCVIDKVDPETFVDLCIDILCEVAVDGKEINKKNFDFIFMDDYLHMYKAILAVLTVNFGSLFKMAGIGQTPEGTAPAA